VPSTATIARPSRDFHAPLRLLAYAKNRYLAWAMIAGGMILGRIALLPVLPAPPPAVHDEFSYLLAADTFAHGRAANPAPLHPEFFESPHVLVDPTYASKFPPGQGLVLALGEKLTGHPYGGVVLSVAVMVFLFCWAADAWLPPQWALIAGVLSAVLFFIRHYWFDSYWGGALAAAGGALLVGGLGHVLRGRPQRAGVSFAVGAVLLFSTRVFEGGVLCVAVVAILLVHSLSIGRRNLLRPLLLPNLAVLAAAVPLVLWYNVRVTGHALEMPYTLYMKQYDLVPPLWVLPPHPAKEFSSVNYAVERTWELDMYNFARGTGRLGNVPVHLVFLAEGAVWQQFLGFGLLLLATPWARMRGRKKWLVLLLGAGFACLFTEVMNFPHYTAPFTCVMLILIVAALRAVWYRLARMESPRLRGLLAGLAMTVLFTFLALDYASAVQAPRETQRSMLIKRLESAGGRHLVFVDYAKGWPAWEPNTEWVYNGADLNQGRILFAHLRSDAENRQLMAEYKNRAAWRVRVGPSPTDVQCEPYGDLPETTPSEASLIPSPSLTSKPGQSASPLLAGSAP